jgi:hypothetical protein
MPRVKQDEPDEDVPAAKRPTRASAPSSFAEHLDVHDEEQDKTSAKPKRGRLQKRDDDEEENPRSGAKPASRVVGRASLAASGGTRSTRASLAAAEPDDVCVDGDDVDDEAGMSHRGSAKGRGGAARGAGPKPPKFIVQGTFALVPLKSDAMEGHPVGEPTKPIQYKLSEKSEQAVSSLPAQQLAAAVSATVRLVFGMETTRQKVTGSDVKTHALAAFAAGDAKHVMCYVRREAAKRLLHVFGFHLYAGDEEDSCKLSDRWRLSNAVESALVNRDLNEESDEATDRKRALVMIVLGMVMLGSHEKPEDELVVDLQTIDLSAKEAADLLRSMTLDGFVERVSRKSASGQTSYSYVFGEKASVELGKRAVLQFLMGATGVALNVEDEKNLLGLQEEEEENEEEVA